MSIYDNLIILQFKGSALKSIMVIQSTYDIGSQYATRYSKKYLKGTGHDFCWSGKPIYHLQKQGNIHMFQNK